MIISTNTRIYLIKFEQSFQKFIVGDLNHMLELLKNKDSYYIEYIKKFDNAKLKFVRISKKDLNNFTSWDTELNELLKAKKVI